MRATLPAALLIAILLPSCASSVATPEEFVEAFYASYPHRLTGGLPRGKSMHWLRPRISDRLHAEYEKTIAWQREWIARHPDEPARDGRPAVILKPPFADGIHFDGSPDGHKTFKVTRAVRRDDGRWDVPVHFWYSPELAGWEHVAIVKEERGRYVLDDVRFLPRDAGEEPVLLTEILASRSED